ncbi:hypothetical protein PV10_00586 [Exophiala mesophila]|uniref:Enoyl reductase (ER) domain-containing protein n=1 Tax=Exophiala mesophila TaxID=212818 RepID=A0A0D1X4P6_EXOME|nr:uncharacterized protein PV10_00586 [Exophiala mesophila]KIV96765.1 hypothetical protein PV10_00586 [Exophiala mesophila]
MESKALVMRHIPGKKGEVYYPIEVATLKVPKPQGTQLLVRISAAALNHRDLFLRHDLYPKPQFGMAMGSDGVGVVVDMGPQASGLWMRQRVIINPGQGWVSHPEAPESPEGYLTLGASPAGTGTLQQYMLVDEADVVMAPEHLSDAEAAAIPAAGLTAWRGLMARSQNAVPGRNILVPGIGGGVALYVLRFAVALGCRVYVTSSSSEKLRRAKELGAAGGVLYTEPDWESKLLALLPAERKTFDAIIDGAGGEIVKSGVKLLRNNGVIVSYGMTVSPTMPYTMKALVRNIQLVGTTMGSRKEFHDMMQFIRTHKIHSNVSTVVQGLTVEKADELEELFRILAKGSQFGKLVVQIWQDGRESRL